MKRLGMFVLYSRDGYVHDYVKYLLSEVAKNLSRLVIVINGTINETGKDDLKHFSHDIFFRDNEGFDGGAYSEVILNILGEDVLKEYDQLLLFNDTVFGPFYPLDEVFEVMSKKEVDFWGMSVHPEYNDGKYHYEKHIQSYFLNVNYSLLHSDCFYDFWKQLPCLVNYESAVNNFEIGFSSFFDKHGYTSTSYIEALGGYDSNNQRYDYNILYYDKEDLIINRRFPFLKKKDFSIDSRGRNSLQSILSYLDDLQLYDIGMIWTVVLRQNTLNALFNSMDLVYINNSHECKATHGEITLIVYLSTGQYLYDILTAASLKKNIGNILLLYSSQVDGVWINDIVNKSDTRISISKKCLDMINEDEIHFLTECLHDYVVFITEEHTYGYANQTCYSDYQMKECLEIMIGDNNYCSNIIGLFSHKRYLGVLSLPSRNYDFHNGMTPFWKTDYEIRAALFDYLGYDNSLTSDKCCFENYSFWCRKTIMNNALLGMGAYCSNKRVNLKTFVSLLRETVSYQAQKEGFYSALLFSEEAMQTEYVNQRRLYAELLTDYNHLVERRE